MSGEVSALSINRDCIELTVLASNLRLGNDQLHRVAAVGLIDGVVQNADSLEQVSGDLGLAREVRRISDDLLGLGLKLHGFGLVVTVLHRRLNSGDLAVLVKHLVDVGVQHVCTAVNGRQTSETLGQLAETVERVDIWRFSVACHRVDIQADTVNCFDGGATLVDIFVGGVQSHGVTDEITGIILEAKLVVNLLHRARMDVQSWWALAICFGETPGADPSYKYSPW
jgi:hypothetical protein